MSNYSDARCSHNEPPRRYNRPSGARGEGPAYNNPSERVQPRRLRFHQHRVYRAHGCCPGRRGGAFSRLASATIGRPRISPGRIGSARCRTSGRTTIRKPRHTASTGEARSGTTGDFEIEHDAGYVEERRREWDRGAGRIRRFAEGRSGRNQSGICAHRSELRSLGCEIIEAVGCLTMWRVPARSRRIARSY
jgi:hypothetical protein